MSVNTGKYVADEKHDGENNAAGIRESRENDKIDSKYGFDRIRDTQERTGYLINMHSTEILDEDRRLVAALDLFFIQMNGSRFKVSVVYEPYFLVLPHVGHAIEVARYIGKKYAGSLARIEHIQKEDLDLANHLTGIKHNYLKLFFPNTTAMNKVRRDILAAVRKNHERDKANTDYIKLLSSSLANNSSNNIGKSSDYMDCIADVREYDVPYHVRVSIDLKLNCGLWYDIRCRPGGLELPIITPRPDILDRPEAIVLAYDIETTKLPLKFPDAQTDQIMMISYMIDGQGYLITNREIISCDVDDFEYTPKPEFEGYFIIYNEVDEMNLIKRFFDHILDIKPHIIVSYNGDFFDWPFVETRAAVYDMDMKREIGFSKNRDGNYLSRPSMHMDCLCWVKRDSYLPVGSQGLKAVAKAKLRYDPVELDPEEMCKMAVEQPQVLSNYSVSDAVATYYLYMKYVNPFIFALTTIIPMEPDEVLRKGSGTLCETLLMVQAFDVNIVFPNKQQSELNKLSDDGHVLDSETYVGGHVEALESGVFRADIPCRFRLDPEMVVKLQANIENVLRHAIEVEENIPLDMVTNLDEIKTDIQKNLQELHDTPNRIEQPVIFHLDVGAMYPNIILTNRLQPSSMVNEKDCAACDFNKPDAKCKRVMDWSWRGEMLPATKNEYQRIQQQLETEKFPPLFPNGPSRAFHELSKEDQAAYEKKRLNDYCRKAYKKTKVTRLENRKSTVCQMENSFYVDTVRAFRDRRYEYKGMTKVAKAAVSTAMAGGDASEIKLAKGREVLYDSLQLAHKCILNSFYGYVMRRGARWHSMSMAGIVCLTGANIIRRAREIVERVGRPLELDTDGIWCIMPATFPQEFTIHTTHEKKKKFNISYPNAVLNTMVKDYFTNDQYHELVTPQQTDSVNKPEYKIREENSIFFEVDGPYLAMVLPAAKEEGRKLKKRYAVFNFDGSLAELKGFEVKRRGELQLIKIFQSSVFEAFLHGNSLEECYASVAKIADYWLDVLYSKGSNMPDTELFELISENRSMSRKLEDYGAQKSTSISTAKRLAEFLGDQMVKDAGLACKYIISKKPEGSPVTERAIPLAIFQSEPSVRRHFLRRWLKDNTMGDADIRDVLDWNYYIERLGGTIQKIITIPAALQGVSNPVPRIAHPDWLHKRMLEKNDVLKQRRINEIFSIKPKPIIDTAHDEHNSNDEENSDEDSDANADLLPDIEDMGANKSRSTGSRPIARKRNASHMEEDEQNRPKTWREALGPPTPIGNTREDIIAWIIFHKKKWEWQLQNRNQRISVQSNKISRTEQGKRNKSNVPAIARTIGGFIRYTHRIIIEQPWQIIQIAANDELGSFTVWAMVSDQLQKIKLNIPRIFYVNKRSPAPDEADSMWKKVHRTLPRARPVYHLYQYMVGETVFKDSRLGMLADLATPDIEGIYETQMSLELRALIQLGCVCSVQRMVAKQICANKRNEAATTLPNSFSIEQLEPRSQSHQAYLKGDGVALERLFLYQHSSGSGKQELWGLFIPAINRAVIVFYDTVRTNQMPPIRTFYNNERTAFMNAQNERAKVPPEELKFDIFFEVDHKLVYRHITNLLTAYNSEMKGPSLLCIQTSITLNKLNVSIPIASEFPQTQIFIVDDAALLVGLDWQRNGTKSMLRHFFNLENVVHLMLEQCRYYNLPIGNMPADPIMFGADIFYARLLQKHNFLLWTSPTCKPDLGGREADDNRLLSEFEESTSVVQNKSGYYDNVCVELAIDSLAVTALLQANKIQEMEGASSAITFDAVPQASLEEMISNNPSAMLSSYDESALCSAAMKIMRSMVNGWLREVAIDRNVFADFQIVHFYRWIRSSTSLLYDPALRRSLNNLMQKIFLQLIAEFQRLNATIIYADFNRIILNSGKKSVVDAISYVEYVVQSIRNKELFHSINLTYQQSWKFLLWLDTTNYSGAIAKIPRELRLDETTQNTDSMANETVDDENEINVDMIWNISEQLTDDKCRDEFDRLMRLFMDGVVSKNSPKAALEAIKFQAYDVIQKMHKGYAPGKVSAATHLINALTKILSNVEELNDEILEFRRNMLRLISLGEFSDLAQWQESIHTYILNEVICKACNQCRDIDLCKDKDRATVGNTPVWLCSQCYVYYENEEIEIRLIDVLHRKIMSYTLQDLRCNRCKQIKMENIAELCSCAGAFDTLVNKNELRQLLQTFLAVAENHQMTLLKDQIELFLANSY